MLLTKRQRERQREPQDVQNELPWELLYADDLAIIDVTSTDTQNRLETWQKVLTENGLKINVAKTEHLSTRENPLPIKLNGEATKVSKLKLSITIAAIPECVLTRVTGVV